MKNMILIIVSAILGALLLLIVMTINGRMNRSMEIKSSLSSAVEETVENMALTGKYEIGDADEYVADFMGNLCVSMETDSDLTVEITKADMEKGLLSLRVTETFLHPNGRSGTVECERTVILNSTEEKEQITCTVCFYLTQADQTAGENCYRMYRVAAGDEIAALTSPQSTGERFAGWNDGNGGIAEFPLTVTQDMNYCAQWQ